MEAPATETTLDTDQVGLPKLNTSPRAQDRRGQSDRKFWRDLDLSSPPLLKADWVACRFMSLLEL